MKILLATCVLSTATLCFGQSSSDWTVGGYVDGYYQHDFGRPFSGDSVNGRGLDISHNRLRLAVAQLDFARAPKKASPWGLTLQLYAGKNPDLIHLAEPGGKDKYKLVRQAFVSYAAPDGSFTADLGKFDTWIGYEGIDNRYQDQYSRSFNWTYSETTYETGLRVNSKLTDKLNWGFYLVRGWNEVEDGNGRPSAGVTLGYAADPKTTLTLQNHFGDEGSKTANDVGTYGGIGFPNPGTSAVHLVDFIVSHQLTPTIKVAFNFDHATASGGSNDGSWNGEVLYFKHQMSPTQTAALRLDRFEDRDGLRTGMPMQLHSVTGTYDRAINGHVSLRAEIRRDLASQPFFNSNTGPTKERTTLTLAAVIKF